MAGRFVWIAAGAAATIGGIALHSDFVFDDSPPSRHASWEEHADAEAREAEASEVAERIVDEEGTRFRPVDSDGNPIEIDPETARALAEAVGELVRAEASLALLDIASDPGEKRLEAARDRRDRAEQLVEELSEDIDRQAEAAEDVGREQRHEIRDRLRDQIRERIREAVRS